MDKSGREIPNSLLFLLYIMNRTCRFQLLHYFRPFKNLFIFYFFFFFPGLHKLSKTLLSLFENLLGKILCCARGQARLMQWFFLAPKSITLRNYCKGLLYYCQLLRRKKKIYFHCPYTHPGHFEIIFSLAELMQVHLLI